MARSRQRRPAWRRERRRSCRSTREVPRAAQTTAFALDHFLVDPCLREVHRYPVPCGAHDDALDWYLGAIREANRASYVAANLRQPVAQRHVPNTTFGAVDHFEGTATA